MPWWLVLLGLGFAVLTGWLVLSWLLDEANSGDPQAALRIDAIRTGLTVVAGTGGAVALLLAARRQWINERAQRHEETVALANRQHQERAQAHLEAVAQASQRHQERQARAAEHDAAERRVTELYTKAVDLLGGDQPAVRTGGLFALERLAQDHEGHRQTIVDVICAYLRMPVSDLDRLEIQVRATAQRLLARHLLPAAETSFWPGVRLDLTGARLVDFDLSGCAVDVADLTGARFVGPATFADAVLDGGLRLSGGSFEAVATFDGVRTGRDSVIDEARFASEASFARADFAGPASFRKVEFRFPVSFADATFRQPTTFDGSRFRSDADFSRAVVESGLSIERAVFAGGARFHRTRFEDMVLLRWTVFEQDVSFEEATFSGPLNLALVRFHRSAQFEGATLRRAPLLEQTRAAANALHSWPASCRAEAVDDDWLMLVTT